MEANVAARTLQLYLAQDGKVWFGDGAKPEYVAELSPEQIATLDWVLEADRIRLLGLSGNANLIAALCRPRFEFGIVKPRKLELASPGLIPVMDRVNPSAVLALMSRLEYPSSVGGWHDVNLGDYVTYNLIKLLKEPNKPTLPVDARQLLMRHPAWPALSYLPGINVPMAWRLVSTIVDPRWYIDPARPERRGRLYSYLGLYEQNFRYLLDPDENKSTCAQLGRARMVLHTWTDVLLPPTVGDALNSNFLWKCWGRYDTASRGLLRACQMFVDFVCDVWLQSVSPLGRELFVPEYFFHSKDEADLYMLHRTHFPERYL